MSADKSKSRLSFGRLLKISRPKFWHYLGGPYLIALIPAFTTINNWPNKTISFCFAILGLIWYTTIGNFFIYGINDYYDRATDLLNPAKKNNHDEVLISSEEQIALKKWLLVSFFSGILLWSLCIILVTLNLIYLPGIWISSLGLLGFLFVSWCYSAPPIRAKKRPFFDGIFNLLYVLPVISSYGLTGQWPNLSIILAATFWCMAMHAFSAIPDIEADRQAGITTTAVFLKAKPTLVYCIFCYLAAIILIKGIILSAFWITMLMIYILIISVLVFLPTKQIHQFYRYFPYLNLLSGTAIFLLTLGHYSLQLF